MIAETLVRIIAECWSVLGEMAPWLLFGFLFAGILSVLISPSWVERKLGSNGYGSVLRASLFGVPLPLCSCGVIPVSAGLRRSGASKASTTAFLISTPQTGVDSIAITYALLGPVFAVFRPVASLVTGFIGGGLVHLFVDKKEEEAPSVAPATANPGEVCVDCGEVDCKCDDCDDGGCSCQPNESRKIRNPVARILQYSLVTLPRDIGAALLIGVGIAGIIGALIPENMLAEYLGGGILSILVMMVAGVPVYVCATASVPIAAGFIHAGIAPGAALAFLIAGPATNAATITTAWKVLGKKTALIYMLTIGISAVVSGLLLNWLFPNVIGHGPRLGTHQHGGGTTGWMPHAWAAILLLVMIYSYLSGKIIARKRKRYSKETEEKMAGDTGERVTLKISGMTCSHCEQAVRRGLASLPGVRKVEVDLDSGTAWIEGDKLDTGKMIETVDQLGYSARAG